MKHPWPLLVAGAIAAAALGFYFGQAKVEAPSTTDSGSQNAAARLAALTVATPEGQSASLSQWRGKVLIVNFWATWCPPCREEMPEFSRAQDKFADKGVQFVGIGIDTPENIVDFRRQQPVSYPLLMGSYETLKLTAELGNKSSALPFTAILDRQGRLAHVKTGKLSEAELEKLLPPLYSAGP